MTVRRERKDWESWIDEQIRRAQEQGQFENLAGQGKPLDLRPNPYAGDREMAFKILHDAGYAPEWIELDKAIRVRLERARRVLFRAWERYQEAAPEPDSAPEGPAFVRAGFRRASGMAERRMVAWQVAVTAFHEEVAAINLQIAELNLKVPSPRFQRHKVDAGQEVRSLGEGVL
jgi:DnaJ family protein C protein 28